jgi:hypothetical protein
MCLATDLLGDFKVEFVRKDFERRIIKHFIELIDGLFVNAQLQTKRSFHTFSVRKRHFSENLQDVRCQT